MSTKKYIISFIERLDEKNNWFFLLFSRPTLYLYNLLKRTFITGIVLFVLYEIIKHLNIHDQPIPTSWHSSAGIVIGLLLVFRTNTAYDRWWEARKIFANIESSFMYITISCVSDVETKLSLIKINNDIFNYISNSAEKGSDKSKLSFLNNLSELKKRCCLLSKSEKISQQEYSIMEKKICDILESFTSLERIKTTPIPISYSFHIKISLFAYLLTLPFGLFFGFGWVAIPMVMVLFFIIAGIEIISNEIENPFKGDPNDLPMDEFKNEIEKIIQQC